nr:hypothetical protein [Tanacetum cinerariifolium]
NSLRTKVESSNVYPKPAALFARVGKQRKIGMTFAFLSAREASVFVVLRDIAREGHHLRVCVANIISNGDWEWPQAWLQKAPNLGLIPAPMLSDREDCMRWRDGNGNMTIFWVKCAWEALRPKGIEVP